MSRQIWLLNLKNVYPSNIINYVSGSSSKFGKFVGSEVLNKVRAHSIIVRIFEVLRFQRIFFHSWHNPLVKSMQNENRSQTVPSPCSLKFATFERKSLKYTLFCFYSIFSQNKCLSLIWPGWDHRLIHSFINLYMPSTLNVPVTSGENERFFHLSIFCEIGF